MANNNIRVRLTFDADATAAKRQVQELQQTLSNVATMPIGSKLGAQMTAGLQKAQQSAIQLKVALNQATNVNTGKLNLNAFDAQLKKSKMTLTQYAIELSKLGPEGQQAFAQLAQAIASADTPLQALKAKMGKFGTTLGNTIRWSISSALITGVTSSLSSIVDYAKELDESLTKIGIVTGKNTEQMESFAKAAQKAAKALSVSTTDYMEASLIYFQQGHGEREAMKRADVTVKLANVLGEEMETVSDWMTAIWNNFDSGSESIEYYADVLVKLGAATASSADEIAGGMEKFMGIANTVGLSYEAAAAALTTITAATRQSEDVVGTALKTIFARLENLKLGDTLEDGTSLGQYSEALAVVGVNIKDANGELKDMDYILEEAGMKWQTLARDEQVALAQSVAGIRQYSTFMSLMDNWQDYQKNMELAKDSEGALMQQHAIYADSVEAAYERVGTQLDKIKSNLFGADDFKPLLNVTEKLLGFFGDLTESMGGFRTILFMLATYLTKAFSDKIVNGGINLFTSMKNAFTGNSLKTSMLGQLGSASTTIFSPGASAVETADISILQNQTQLTQDLQALEKQITKEAHDQLSLGQQRLQVYENTVRESAKLKDSTQKELDESRGVVEGALAKRRPRTLAGKDALKEAKASVSKYETAVQEEEAFFANETESVEQLQTGVSTIFGGNAAQIMQQSPIYQQLNTDVTTYGQNLERLKQIEAQMNQERDPAKLTILSNEYKTLSNETETLSTKIQMQKRALVESNQAQTKSQGLLQKITPFFKKGKKNLDQYTTSVRSNAKATAQNDKATKAYEKAVKRQEKAMKRAAKGQRDYGQITKTMLGSLAQASMGISMLSSSFESLAEAIASGDMSLSDWISHLGTMLPSLLMLGSAMAPLIQNFTNWLKIRKQEKQTVEEVTAAEEKEIAVTKAQTQADTQETQQDTVDIASNEAETASEETKTAVEGMETAATATQAATDAIETSGDTADVAGNTVEAASEGVKTVIQSGESVSKVPYVGPVLAIASMAAVGAVVAGVLGSTIGGISSGASTGNLEKQSAANDQAIEQQTSYRDTSADAIEASEGMTPLIDKFKEYKDTGKSIISVNEDIAEKLPDVIDKFEELANKTGITITGLKELQEIESRLAAGEIIDPEDLEKYLDQAEAQAREINAQANRDLIKSGASKAVLDLKQDETLKKDASDGSLNFGGVEYSISNADNFVASYDKVLKKMREIEQSDSNYLNNEMYQKMSKFISVSTDGYNQIIEAKGELKAIGQEILSDEDAFLDFLSQEVKVGAGITSTDFSAYSQYRDELINQLIENGYAKDAEEAKEMLLGNPITRYMEMRLNIATVINKQAINFKGDKSDLKTAYNQLFEDEDLQKLAKNWLKDGETIESRLGNAAGQIEWDLITTPEQLEEQVRKILQEQNTARYNQDRADKMKKSKANFDLESDIDIYYEYDKALEQIERSLTAIRREKDKAFGKTKANAIKTEIAQLEKESEVQRKLADQAQERAAELRGTLSQKWGLTFDQNGTLQGYVEKQRALTAEIQKLDEDDSDRERLETELELLNSIVSAYDEAVSKAADAWDTIDENADTISDLKLEDIQIEVEVYAQLSEASLREVEFQLSQLEDLDYEVAVKVTAYQSQYQGKQQEFDSAEKGFNRMLEEKGIDPTAYWAGDQTAKDQFLNANWTQAELDQLKEYQETMNSSVLDMKDSWLSMHETVRSGMEYYNEEMDNGIAKMEHWNTLLEDYNNIIDLVGAKNLGISDDQQLDMLGTQTTILQGQVAAAKSKLDMNKAFLAEAERELANAEDALTKAGESATEEDKRRVEEWKATVQQAQESVMESQEELNQYLTASLEAAMAEKSKAVEIAIKNFMKQLTGYESIDLFNEDRDRMRQQGELFVDEYEKVYNLAKLNREINTSLDKTNLKNRTDLLKLQERINAAQKSGVKMSQFELDNLQKQYQLEMAKIQLEEAQNNKSQVVLKRDTEGNFGYVYTANADKVSEATQKYEDAIYAIMTANEDYMKQCSENMDEALATYLETVQTIEEDMTLTEEERQNRLDQAKTWYLTQQAYYTGEMANVTGITKDLFDQESAKRNETVEQMCGYNQAYVDDYIQTFQPQMSKALSETNGYWDAFAKRIDEETYYNLKDYDKNYISSWDTNFLQAMESRLGEGSDLRTAYQGFVDAIGSPGDQGTGGTGLYGALGTADWNMREDMNKAFEQAGIDVNTHLNGDGENSAKTGLDTFADYLDKLINGGDGEEGLKDKVEDLTDEIEGIKTDGIDKITGTIGALSLWEEQAWGEFNTLFLKVQELNKELVTLAGNLGLEYEDPETKIPLGNGVVLGSYSTSEDEKKWGSYQTYDSYGSVVDGGKAGINLNAGTPYTVTSYTNDKGENFYSLYDSASGKTTIMNETDFKAAGFQPHSETPTTDPDDDDEEQTPTTTNETASFKVGDIINASGFPNGILAYSKNSDGTFTFGVGKNNYDSMIGAGRDDDFDGAKILEVANDTKTGKVFYKLKARGGTSEVWLPQTWSESGSPNYKLEKAAASKYNVNDKVETNASWTSAWTVRAYKWDSNTGNFVSGDLESGKLTIAEKRFWNNKWYYRNQGDDWFWGGQLRTYDTGGYTGSWGPEGRLAMLHQKEIVLNAHDTENFLTAINIVRSMADRLEANAKLTQQGLLSYATAITPHNYRDTLEQNVTIHAEFPNATNHSEIEEAFGNLVNLAAQYASRTY